MHCANLDTPVKGTIPQHSPQRIPQQQQLQQQNTETMEEENSRILKTVLDAGILILEGRLPEPTSKRGYVEGPHCVLHPQSQTHQCDLNRYMCKRSEKYRNLISSLWNECKGICIELRVCADCSCGEEQVWKNTSSNFDYILEQWCFEVTNVRNEGEDLGVMNLHGLMQAIRSQIHFSQLSAWWSNNRAQLPKNITYHVLPLIQADSNSCSLRHKFPVLSFTTMYLQVKLRSQPRSETLPNVHCPVHCCNKDNVVDDRMKVLCDRFGKHHCQAVEDLDENDNETWCDKHKHVDVDQVVDGDVRELKDCEGEKANTAVSLPKKYKKSTKKYSSIDAGTKRNTSLKYRGTATRLGNEVVPELQSKPIRNGCYIESASYSVFIPSNDKNIFNCHEKKLIYSPKRNYYSINSDAPTNEDKVKFDLSASAAGKLAEETTAQFFNICNWTNSMVSSVVSRMRNGNSFLNNFPDPNALSDFFTFAKTDSDKSSADGSGKCDDTNIRINSNNYTVDGRIKVEINPSQREQNGSRVRIDQPTDCENEQSSQYTNAITSTFACGDTNSKIISLKNKTPILPSDSASMRMDINSEEIKRNAFRGCYRPISLCEKNFEEIKLRSFREKRFNFENSASRKRLLPFAGNVIESVLSGRVHFTNSIENFKIKVTSGGSFSIQNCTDLPAAAYYYHFGDGCLSKSYLVKSFIPENEKGIQIPNAGRLQVGIFNTEESLIKVFTVSYDLSDMPRCSKTFLRHSNYFNPKCASDNNVKWLQSFLQLKCRCSKSGRLYLQSEINAIMFQKSDLNTACELKMKTDLMHQDVTEIAYKKDTSF